MKKIALIGPHGVRKTTFIYNIAGILKDKGIDAEILREIARKAPGPINKQATIPSQEWIIYSTYVKELEEQLMGAPDVLLCDRSVLDGYVYYLNLFGENKLVEQFIKEKIQTYDQLWYVSTEFTILKADGVRDTDQDYQLEIANQFQSLIKKLGISVYKFKSIEEVVYFVLNDQAEFI